MTEGRRRREEWVDLASDVLVGLFNGILVSILGGPVWAGLMTSVVVFQVLRLKRS